MGKPNVIFVGEPDQDDVDSFLPLDNIIVIQCESPEQLREIIRSERTEFTVFCGSVGQERPCPDCGGKMVKKGVLTDCPNCGYNFLNG